MLENKYKSPAFGAMWESDLITAAEILMLKIHVITGWKMPEGQLIAILTDQFAKKLKESFARVNSEEIEYAFRNPLDDLKDWGKAMNLDLIDKIMQPYLQKRALISRVEEQKMTLPAPKQDEVSDDEFIDSIYNIYKATKTYTAIPELAYTILESKLELSKQDKIEIMLRITVARPELDEVANRLACRQYAVGQYFETNYKK